MKFSTIFHTQKCKENIKLFASLCGDLTAICPITDNQHENIYDDNDNNECKGMIHIGILV
jgi:hypothetical protein